MPIRKPDDEEGAVIPTQTTMILQEEKKKNSVDNKLELLKYTTEVQSRINKDITSDFVLARMGEQDKTGVIEMTVNGYLATRQIKNIILNAEKWSFYEDQWHCEEIDTKVEERINDIQRKVFDTFMTKVTMTALLNRNVDRNRLIEVLSGLRREEMEEEVIQEEKGKNEGLLAKIKNKLKKKEEQPM